jgi:hypothetical protein
LNQLAKLSSELGIAQRWLPSLELLRLPLEKETSSRSQLLLRKLLTTESNRGIILESTPKQKEKEMKIGTIVGAVLSLLVIVTILITCVTSLLSMSSNAAVGLGLLLAIVAVSLFVGGASWLFKKARPAVLGLFLLTSMASSGCYTVVEPGNVGILVNQSGSDKGVQDYPLQSGRVFYNPITETVFTYPIHVQRAVWTKDPTEGSKNNEEINYNSKDEMVFTGDLPYPMSWYRVMFQSST